MFVQRSATRQALRLASRTSLPARQALPARQQLLLPSSTLSRLQPSVQRHLSTSGSLASPPTPTTPSPSPPPSRLSLSDRSHLVRSSTRRQLLALQLELEQLRRRLPNRSNSLRLSLLLALVTLLVTYQFSGDFRRVLLAGKRCALIGVAVAGCIVDYKMLFRKTWAEDEVGNAQRHEDYEDCHRGCAERIREVLKKNGGIYIKVRALLASSEGGEKADANHAARTTPLLDPAHPPRLVFDDEALARPVLPDASCRPPGTLPLGRRRTPLDVLLDIRSRPYWSRFAGTGSSRDG